MTEGPGVIERGDVLEPEAGTQPASPLARPGIGPPQEYEQFFRGFRQAWARNPDQRHERWFTFADRPARIRVAGGGLADHVFRAFSHLARDPGEEETAALTVELWDERACGVGVEGLGPGDDLNADGATFVSDDGWIVVTARTQLRTAYQRVARHLVGWVGRHDHLTQYEVGRPLHSELMLWHKDLDVQAIHSGLVARDGNGVLFGGPGGSGKSTTALTCLEAGLQYLADDYVALMARPDGSWIGHSLYCSTHLEPGHLEKFPFLQPHAVPGRLPREDKSLVMLSEVHPGGLGRKACIRAVALPVVRDVPTPTLREASKVESLLRLAPSSLLMLPYGGIAAGEFEKLSRFLEDVPTYWLELGGGMEEIPHRIDEILERHS